MRWFAPLVFLFLTLPTHAVQLSLGLGLYTQHQAGNSFVDYRREGDQSLRPMNDGPMINNLLMVFLLKHGDTEWGLCSFKNSYYDNTWCLLANIVKPISGGFSVHAGVNVNHGYREALVKQDPNASMHRLWLIAPQAGVRYQVSPRNSFSLDSLAGAAVTLSYVLKLQ